MRLRDGDAAVRLPGGVAPRIRYPRLGSREIRCGSRRRGDPDGKIQGAVERLDETAVALVFPIPDVISTRAAASSPNAVANGAGKFEGGSSLDARASPRWRWRCHPSATPGRGTPLLLVHAAVMQRRRWHLPPCLRVEKGDAIGQRQIYTQTPTNRSVPPAASRAACFRGWRSTSRTATRGKRTIGTSGAVSIPTSRGPNFSPMPVPGI